MPQEIKYKSLGCEVSIQVPSNVEDFDINAKRAGACLSEAINNVVYRGVLADFREAFCDAVEASTSITRRSTVVGKTKETKEDILKYENEGDYVNRVRVEKGWVEDNTALQAIATEVSSKLVFDASATERKGPGPKKLPNAYKAAAAKIFANGNQDKWATKFGITLTGDATKDADLIGWGIKRDVEKAEAEKLAGIA